MALLVGGLLTSSLLGLQLFKPASNPLIFVANSLEIGHRDAHVRSTVPLVGHLLKLVEILQTRLKKSQALLQDRLSFLWFEKFEERDPCKKLRFIGGLFRWKIAQQ